MLFFRAKVNIPIFCRFSPENILILYLNYNKKERIYHILLAVCPYFFPCILQTYISCTVHRTVISTEHLAITNAGFCVLLGIFAVEGSNNLVRLS